MQVHGDGFDPLTPPVTPLLLGIIALSIRRCRGAAEGGLILFTVYGMAPFDPDGRTIIYSQSVSCQSRSRGKSPEDRG